MTMLNDDDAAAVEVRAYARQPLADSETALADVADWGPAEDWSDWADAKG